jgi:hypothetical protein
MDWNNQHQPLPHETLRNSHAYQQYQRQRQMTLGDLLLENRIVFLQGEIGDEAALPAERKSQEGRSLLH